ncbi:MAG: M15 family metallopeptidase [Spirochaetota bacterium]
MKTLLKSPSAAKLYFLTWVVAAFAIPAVGCMKVREIKEKPVHPVFSITELELGSVIETLRPEIKDAILKRPQYFLELVDQLLQLPADTLILVDKHNPLPRDYEPDDLILLAKYDLGVGRNDLKVRRRIMPDLLAMDAAARVAGIDLIYSSAYRSWAYQEEVYKKNVRELGQEQADRESAQPGKSQHQLGTAVDFGSITDNFALTPSGRWLKAYAWEYGFSLSYPEGMETITGYRYESWHYRYISRTGTRMEKEFFAGSQQYFLEFWKERKDYFKGKLVR